MRKKLVLAGVLVGMAVSVMACGGSGKNKEGKATTVDQKNAQTDAVGGKNAEDDTEKGTTSEDDALDALYEKYNVNKHTYISPGGYIIDFPKANDVGKANAGERIAHTENSTAFCIGTWDKDYCEEFNVAYDDVKETNDILDVFIEEYIFTIEEMVKSGDVDLISKSKEIVKFGKLEFVKMEGEFAYRNYDFGDQIGNIILYGSKLSNGEIFYYIVLDGNVAYHPNNDETLSIEDLEEVAEKMLDTIREYDCDFGDFQYIIMS